MARIITQKSGSGPKYKQMYKRMKEENEELFKEFKVVHDKFVKDSTKYRSEFNKVGDKFADQMRIYIDHLCRTSEGMGHASAKLADKFRDEVRKEFSELDEIGIE